MAAEQRRELADDLARHLADVRRAQLRGLLGPDPHGGEDRIDQPVEPADLVHGARYQPARRSRRSGSRELPPSSWRLLGQKVGVGAHDRERRSELVGDHAR